MPAETKIDIGASLINATQKTVEYYKTLEKLNDHLILENRCLRDHWNSKVENLCSIMEACDAETRRVGAPIDKIFHDITQANINLIRNTLRR